MEQKYDLIFVIVDAEQHDTVIEACNKSHAQVYTAFSAQGSVGKKVLNFFLSKLKIQKKSYWF